MMKAREVDPVLLRQFTSVWEFAGFAVVEMDMMAEALEAVQQVLAHKAPSIDAGSPIEVEDGRR